MVAAGGPAVGGGAVAQSQSELTRQQLFVCQRESPRDSSLFPGQPTPDPPERLATVCVRASCLERFSVDHAVSSRQQQAAAGLSCRKPPP